MNNKLITPSVVVPFLLSIVILFNIAYFTSSKGSTLNDTCVSVLRTRDFLHDFNSAGTVTMVMNPDHSGYVALSGNITSNDVSTTLFREIYFSYQKESKGNYRFYNFETVKHLADNTPDRLVDSIFLSTSNEKDKHMMVSKIMNAYVIGNLHSPVFICVVK